MFFYFFRLQVRISPLFDICKGGWKVKQKESDHMDMYLPTLDMLTLSRIFMGFFIAPVDLEQMDLKIWILLTILIYVDKKLILYKYA